MSRPKEVITFDHVQLLLDIEVARLGKWAAFEAHAKSQGAHIPHDKWIRAKKGDATFDTLVDFCHVLERPIERYYGTTRFVPLPSTNLTGSWIALYLESRRQGKIVRTWERLRISQRDRVISGFYDFIKTDAEGITSRTYAYAMKGRVYGDCITGFYWVRRRISEHGIGTFQLKLRPDGILAEGYCSFYGHDGFIAASQNFWVLEDGSPESLNELEMAEEAILANKVYFELPKPPGLFRP